MAGRFRMMLLASIAVFTLIVMPFLSDRFEEIPPFNFLRAIPLGAASLIRSTAERAGQTWSDYVALRDVSRENRALREELSRAQLALALSESTHRQNEQLRELLDFRDRIDLPVHAARVVMQDPEAPFEALWLHDDTGKIRQGDIVLSTRGLVGRVTKIQAKRAQVLTAMHPNSAIDAVIVRTSAHGMLKGGGNPRAAMHYVPWDADVRIGDRVVTGGADGLYPPGLPLGVVADVRRPTAGLEQDVEIDMAEPLRGLRMVLVSYNEELP